MVVLQTGLGMTGSVKCSPFKLSDSAVRWIVPVCLGLHTVTQDFFIPRFIISLLQNPLARSYSALRFICVHMVGIGVDSYFFPADSDSQLVSSARVQVLVEA